MDLIQHFVRDNVFQKNKLFEITQAKSGHIKDILLTHVTDMVL